MQIVTNLHDASRLLSSGCCATIGNFDGVHLGHQQLIRSVTQKSEEAGLPSVVITLHPHPQYFFHPKSAPLLLMSEEAKLEAIASLGVDVAVVLPFTETLASLSAEEFVTHVLVEGLQVRHLFVGHDYVFGKGRKGNASSLAEMGKTFGFSVEQLLPVFYLGSVVSSTRIRNCVQSGDVALASSLLGRPFFVDGTVIHGKNRGGTELGFPTANLGFSPQICTPRAGVYVTRVDLLDGSYLAGVQSFTPEFGLSLASVTSVGMNPTFGDVPLSVETFILDFKKDIYHTPMRLWFYAYLRDEVRFDSIDALVRQITQDAQDSRDFFDSLRHN